MNDENLATILNEYADDVYYEGLSPLQAARKFCAALAKAPGVVVVEACADQSFLVRMPGPGRWRCWREE